VVCVSLCGVCVCVWCGVCQCVSSVCVVCVWCVSVCVVCVCVCVVWCVSVCVVCVCGVCVVCVSLCVCKYVCVWCVCVCLCGVCACVRVRAIKSKLAVLCLKLNYSEMFAGNQYRSDLFSAEKKTPITKTSNQREQIWVTSSKP